MNKFLMMLAAILMAMLNPACSNEDEEVNNEWGTSEIIPGELIPSYEGGTIYIMWEKPHINWFGNEYLKKLKPEIKRTNPNTYPEGTYKDDCFRMLGITKCNNLNDLAPMVADLYWDPENKDSQDEYTYETKKDVEERFCNHFPSEIDFNRQSVFFFYFLSPDSWNTVALFTNPANKKPVFVSFTSGQRMLMQSCEYRPRKGVMGYIVIDTPGLGVKDIEIWSKISDIKSLNQDFDKEFPDWKYTEWIDKAIFPSKCPIHYFEDNSTEDCTNHSYNKTKYLMGPYPKID